jgi:hypothetical protein
VKTRGASICLILAWASFSFGLHTQSRVGIVSAGLQPNTGTGNMGRLKALIKRALENSPPWSPIVEIIPGSLSTEELDVEVKRNEMEGLLAKLKKQLFASDSDSELMDKLIFKIDLLQKRLREIPRFGPLTQRTLLLTGAVDWMRGEMDRAQKKIRQAIEIHPSGQIEKLHTWDEESHSFNAAIFDEYVVNEARKMPRECSVDVQFETATHGGIAGAVSLSVNGFDVIPGKTLNLGRANYYFNAHAGKFYGNGYFECARAAKHSISINMKDEKTAQGAENGTLRRQMEDVSLKYGLSYLVVVNQSTQALTRRPEVSFFLYTTSDSRLDELQMSKPTSLADLDVDVGTRLLQTALPFFQKHSQDVDWASIRLTSPVRDSTVIAPRWYNNWVLWAVAGGVIGSSAIIYLGTRSPPAQGRASAGSIDIVVKFE